MYNKEAVDVDEMIILKRMKPVVHYGCRLSDYGLLE
jgi:hypothetical protein